METPSKSHIGRKIARIRELRGIKQEALAFDLGISQQSLSLMEHAEEVDDKKLQKIAAALGVSVEAIRNFSEEGVINYFNTFNDQVSSSNFGHGNQCTFNPLDKLMESVEENKRLYEQLLQAEREKVGYLEKLLSEFRK